MTSPGFKPHDFVPWGRFVEGKKTFENAWNEREQARKGKSETYEMESFPYSNGNQRMHLCEKDVSPPRPYLNDPIGNVWLKCLGITLIAPIVHVICLPIVVIPAIHRMIVAFSKSTPREEKIIAIVRLILSPLAPVLLTLSALYGLLLPYVGRKLYATYERLFYGSFCIAPCFQPHPRRHFFGGDIYEKGAW